LKAGAVHPASLGRRGGVAEILRSKIIRDQILSCPLMEITDQGPGATRSVTRFVQYTLVGMSTFALDLFLLFILTDLLRIHYVLSAGLAFLIAISINYFLSRRFVFAGTLRSIHAGYTIFLAISGAGLLLVVVLMYVAVDILNINYLLSRVLIAGIVGIWNYLMNLYVNFKVS